MSCTRDSLETKVHADLHTHTTCSDGCHSPTELVTKAATRGIQVLAITDHDTVRGVEEAEREAEKRGIDYIPGIEFSADVQDREVHILAYGIDPEGDRLHEHIQKMQAARERRAWRMVERLGKVGLTLNESTVEEKISETHSVGRPHIAELLVKAGYVKNTDRAFEQYLGENGPGYVAKPNVEAKRVLSLINHLGGVSVLAHPGHWTSSRHIRALVDLGLCGIELWHPAHDSSLRSYYARIARDYNLCTTGGSDYHGRTKEDDYYFGRVGMPETEWERFSEVVA